MNTYIININKPITVKLYGIGNTNWGDGNKDSLNEHYYQVGIYTVYSDLYTSDRNNFKYDKDTVECIEGAVIDLSVIDDLPDNEKKYFFFKLFNNHKNLVSAQFLNTINITTEVKTAFMFNNCTNLSSIYGLENINANNVTDMQNMFNNCINLNQSTFNTNMNLTTNGNLVDFKCVYRNCKKLTKVNLPMTQLRNKRPADCLSMFEGCESLTTVNNLLDYSITNARSMFTGCKSLLTAPEMYLFDCKDLSFMFQNCYSLLNIDKINFTNVKDMSVEWSVNSNIRFCTPERCRCMFGACHSLQNLDLSNIRLNNIITLSDRPDIIMDESILSGIPKDCVITNYNSWEMPIDYHINYYGIMKEYDNEGNMVSPNFDNIENYVRTLEEAKSTFQLVYSDSGLYICSNSKNYPGIFFTNPNNFIESEYYDFNYGDNTNLIEYNKRLTIDGEIKIFNIAKRVFYEFKDEISANIIPYSDIYMYVYEKGVKYLFNKTTVKSYYSGYKILNYSLISDCNLPLNFSIDGYYLGLPRIYSSADEYKIANFIIIEKNNNTFTNDITTPINEIKTVSVYYPERTTSIKFIGKNSNYPNYLKEIIHMEGVLGDVNTYKETFKNCIYLENVDLSLFCNNINTIGDNLYDLYYLFNFDYCFYNCKYLKSVNLSQIDCINDSEIHYVNMDNIFYSCNSLIEDSNTHSITLWNNFKLNGSQSAFAYCNNIKELDLSNINMINYASNMFEQSGIESIKLKSLPKICTKMFINCNNLVNLDCTSWDISNLRDSTGMFYGCINLERLDLSTWNTYSDNYKSFSEMFGKIPDICSIIIDNSLWDLEKMSETSTGFAGDFTEKNDSPFYMKYSINGDQYEFLSDNSGYNKLLPLIFVEKRNNVEIETGRNNYERITVKLKDGSKFNYFTDDKLFSAFPKSSPIKEIKVYFPENTYSLDMPDDLVDIYINKSYNLKSFDNLFANCKFLTTARIDLPFNVTDISRMFYNCTNLTHLDLSNWNTYLITNMAYTFYNCTNLNYLNLSSWDTSSVNSSYGMFEGVSYKVDWGYNEENYNKFTLTEEKTNFTGLFPWIPETTAPYIEYTVSDYDYDINGNLIYYKDTEEYNSLCEGGLMDKFPGPIGQNYYKYIPKLYIGEESSYDYLKIEINDVEVESINDFILFTEDELKKNPVKIRLYYPRNATSVKFGIPKDEVYQNLYYYLNHIWLYLDEEEINSYTYNRNKSYIILFRHFDIQNFSDLSYIFSYIDLDALLVTINVIGKNVTYNATSTHGMFEFTRNLRKINNGIRSATLFTDNVEDMSYMFYCGNGDSIQKFSNTDNLKDMSYMFYDHHNAHKVLSTMNTKNVENMSYAFYVRGISDEAHFNYSSIDTSSVKNCENMFKVGEYTNDKGKRIIYIDPNIFTLTEEETGYDGTFIDINSI